MREQTSTLVNAVKGEIEGSGEDSAEVFLRRAWIAFRLASMEGEVFGARSFTWIALGSVFDAITEIENIQRAPQL